MGDPRKGSEWEVPEASPDAAASAPDPWKAPGHDVSLPNSLHHYDPLAPFSCEHCQASLRLEGVYARDGRTFCFECAPPGSVKSADLPADMSLTDKLIKAGLFQDVVEFLMRAMRRGTL